MNAPTVTRSIVLPVAGPVDATWPEFREALRESWGESTRCANWMMTELYTRDVSRAPGVSAKMPKMPRVYLYPEARMLFPTLASQTVASLEREVTRKYRALRYKLKWTQEISLPNMRYPVGLPIPSQMWRIEHNKDGAWLFSARIGQRRYSLRLASGHGFRRQYDLLARALTTDSVGAATIYRRTMHESDHRNGDTATTRVMVRFPLEVPVAEPRDAKGVMAVSTSAEAVLKAVYKGRRWWAYETQVLRAIRAHERQLAQLSNDLKLERRFPKSQREGMVERMGCLAHRHEMRMRSWLHEIAAHVVNYAQRQHVAQIDYDDSERGLCAKFPWFELRMRVKEKCEVAGIKFNLVASGEVPDETPEPLESVNV